MKYLFVISCAVVVALAMLLGSYFRGEQERRYREQTANHLAPIEQYTLPKYEGHLKVEISATLSKDQRMLHVRYSGEGRCNLIINAAFSDYGKKLIGFYLEDSSLHVSLQTAGFTVEQCIIPPEYGPDDSKYGKYDATLTYQIPGEYDGKFENVIIRCLIFPFEQSSAHGKLYDPILVEGVVNGIVRNSTSEQSMPKRTD